LAGLKIPKATLDNVNKFLDSVEAENGNGYGYTAPTDLPTTTAVGVSCRLALGASVDDKATKACVNTLRNYPPGVINSMYYYFYATPVLYRMGDERWEAWNEKMRDRLIDKQDKGDTPKHAHQKGSWSPEGDAHGLQGGRIMQTSLSLLTLEVYYRYPREVSNEVDK
jgi:hypothetical protein